MSLTERQLVDALSTYAEGVDMTTSDLDRMQHDLHERLGRSRPTRRRRLLLVAAAVLVLVAAAAAGVLWLRRPEPVVPATPQGMGPLPAITFDKDATGSNLSAVHADGTVANLPGERDLVHPIPRTSTLRWSVDGNTIVNEYTDDQGRTCRATRPWKAESDGLISVGAGPLVGPACDSSALPPSTSTRLSPASEAGRKLTPNSGGEHAVIDPTQLSGVWLLEGTGLLLAADLTAGSDSADYLLDDDGDIDTAPDARGSLTVTADGRVTLTATGCAETVLGNAQSTGIDTLSSLTATVVSDPCDRFGGTTVLTWVKVL